MTRKNTAAIRRSAQALWLLSVLAGTASAAVYTWTDDQGVRHFSDQAASPAARSADLSPMDNADRAGQPASDTHKQESPTARPASGAQGVHAPHIAMPAPHAVLDDPNQPLIVALTLGDDQPLAENETLVYRLDGRVLDNVPARATRLAIDHLGAGPHRLEVALQTAGKDTGRTDSVSFSVSRAAADTSATRPTAGHTDRPPS